jgi:hypothetical protein
MQCTAGKYSWLGATTCTSCEPGYQCPAARVSMNIMLSTEYEYTCIYAYTWVYQCPAARVGQHLQNRKNWDPWCCVSWESRPCSYFMGLKTMFIFWTISDWYRYTYKQTQYLDTSEHPKAVYVRVGQEIFEGEANSRSHPFNSRSHPFNSHSHPFNSRSHPFNLHSHPFNSRSHPFKFVLYWFPNGFLKQEICLASGIFWPTQTQAALFHLTETMLSTEYEYTCMYAYTWAARQHWAHY